MPGDKVFIPDLEPKTEYGDTRLRHNFRLLGVPVRLRFRLQDCYGNPRPNLPFSLDVDGRKTNGKTDDNGMIDEIIEPGSKKATIVVTPPGSPEETHKFDLGHMNPAQEITGIQSRLRNLSFYGGEISGTLDDATKTAIEKFQHWAKMPVTGTVTPELISALSSAHGG